MIYDDTIYDDTIYDDRNKFQIISRFQFIFFLCFALFYLKIIHIYSMLIITLTYVVFFLSITYVT